MKKQYLLIPVVALLAAGTLVGCAHEHTYDATKWDSDEHSHWNPATCEHTEEKANEADHTAGENGACTTCGYQVNPDVTSVAKAVAVASANGDLINSGNISSDYSSYTFLKGDGWFRLMKSQYFEGYWESYWDVLDEYYIVYGTGEMDVWHVYNDYGEYKLGYQSGNISAKTAQGYAYEAYSLYGGSSETLYYGTEALVSGLFAAAGDSVTTSITDGVYSFDFVVAAEKEVYEDGSVAETAPVYQVEVDFTLGASYTFNKVNVKSSVWYSVADGQVPADTDAAAVYSYEIEQTMGEGLDCPYDPAELIATAWELVDADAQAIGDTVTVDQGATLELTLASVAPSTADFKWDGVAVTAVDDQEQEVVFGTWGWGNDYEYDVNGNVLSLKSLVAGEYQITVSTANVSKTFTLVVETPQTTEIYATIDDESATTANVYTNVAMKFGVEANAYADNAATVSISAPTGSNVTEVTLDVDTGLYTFTPDVVGEYVITITSAADNKADGIEAWTLRVTAEEMPDVTKVLSGTWSGTDMNNKTVTVVFTPDAEPSDGNITSGSATISYQKYSNALREYQDISYSMTYTYSANGFACEFVDSSYEGCYELGLTDDFVVICLSQFGYKMATLEQEGASQPAEVATLFVGNNDVEITDTYGFFDLYTFIPSEAGTYKFTLPADIGMYSKEARDAYGAAEVDFGSSTESTYEVTLDANEVYKVYFGAMTAKGTYTVAIKKMDSASGDQGQNTGNGTVNNPFIISENGTFTASVVDSGYVYYTYTATAATTVTLTFTGTNYYLESGTFNFNLCNPSSAAENVLSVGPGQTLYIKVTVYEPVDGTFEVPFTIVIG